MSDPALPVLAGRYRALSRLGAGGMGVVWRAWDEMLHREVAIKEVRPAPHLPAERHREVRERAMREARAAARLGHPAIVAVHDVIEQNGLPWIVMDLVRGRSLDRVIREDGPLSPERTARIGLAVLDALTFAHRQGIMHRDVKPPNIMIASDGGVLLTDFGIAALAGDPELTSPGDLVGSPGYIAPERLRGLEDGPAADLWSLGATLYTAVEGRAPFHRPLPVAVLGAVLTQNPPPPSRAGGLGPVLSALLAKEPRDRPGVAEVREALRRVAAGLPAGALTPARAPVPAGRPGSPVRRGRVVLVGLAVAAAVGGGVFALTRNGYPRAATPVPTVDAGRFTAAPDACGLLTPAQARAVAPGTPRPGEGGRCDWGGPSERSWLRVTVTHYGPRQGRSADEVARAFLLAERSKIGADAGAGPVGEVRPPRDVAGVGKDSFAYETVTLGSRAYSTVVFRSGNLLVTVELSADAPRPTRALRDNTLHTARLIADELNSRI